MILGIDSTLNLGVALIDIKSGVIYNWITQLMDSGGLVAGPAHIRAAIPTRLFVAPQTSGSMPPIALHANTKYVDVEDALESNPKLAIVWYILDANGIPNSIYAIDSNPAQGKWGNFTVASQ